MAAYILLGPEEGEKVEFIQKERARIRASFPDAEEYVFFGGDEDGDGIASALSQGSLFSSYRFVVLKHFENVKKSDASWGALEDFGDNPQDDCTVIVTSIDSYATAFPKSFASLAGKENTITFWEMKDGDKRRWIIEKVRKEGFHITQDAVDEILSSVENNTQEMKSLVESITNFLRIQKDGERQITMETIEAHSSRTKGENGYTLFRAIGEGNLEKALLTLSSILLNDPREMIPALSVLAVSFRRLEACQEMLKAGVWEEEVFKNVTIVSPYSTVGKKQSKGISFREKDLYRKAMKYYTLEDTRRIIRLLGTYDKAIKAAGTDMLKLTAEKMVYTIVINKGKETEVDLNAPLLSSNYFRS